MKKLNGQNTSSTALHVKQTGADMSSIDEIQYQKLEMKRLKREGLSHLYNADYQPARYKVACQYRDQRSYKKKLGNNAYRQLGLYEDTNQFKDQGLGPYLYIEFMRRVVWLFLALSIIQGIRIYIFSASDGLSDYSSSFSTYLIMTTIGNYNGPVLSDYDNFIVTIIPGVVLVVIFIWFLLWKHHYFSTITEYEESNDIIKPQKFCVQIEGINEHAVEEQDLVKFFSVFGPIYQVSLVRRHKNMLSYFQELEELDEMIKEEELETILGSGDHENLRGLKKERDELNKYISTLKISQKILSAYIHFQFEKSKVDMLTYYNDNYLFNTIGHSIARGICCCCINDPTSLQHYKGQLLYVKSENVPEPEDINWQSREISAISKFCRVMIGVVIIVIFIALSCTIIGLCSIYISGHSINCEGISIPISVKQAIVANQSEEEKRCFCNANLFNSFNDVTIKDYCGTLIDELATEQGIQYAVVAASGFTNFLFGMIVHWMVSLTRPESFSHGLLVKNVVYTFFMIFNTIFLPLLIYADIFGFKASNYVSLLTLVSKDLNQFFSVDSIQFQADFDRIWYRNVSPVFTNYIVFDILITWFFFIWSKCISNKSGLEDDEGKILQKHMNQKITAYKFNLYVEFSYFLLIMTLCFIYGAGIPVLYPLGMISLFTKYTMARSLIQNNSSRIEGLSSEYFNSFSLILIPILLIFTSIFGEWMITGNDSIYPSGMSVSIDLGNTFDILDRQLYLPWFIIFGIVAAFYFLFYNTIVRFCSWLASLCYNRKAVIHPYHAQTYSDYAKKLSGVISYNIRNNDKFKNAIINLEKHLTSEKI